ncbi:14563_t:CDS:2, partial [Racocetra persica]
MSAYFLSKEKTATTPRGEEVPEEEVELDRYGMPKIKAGQEIVKEEVHDVAQEQYILQEGSALEIQTWRLKKDKALCWVEAMGMGDCKSNQVYCDTDTWPLINLYDKEKKIITDQKKRTHQIGRAIIKELRGGTEEHPEGLGTQAIKLLFEL